MIVFQTERLAHPVELADDLDGPHDVSHVLDRPLKHELLEVVDRVLEEASACFFQSLCKLGFVCRDFGGQFRVVGEALLPPLGGFLADAELLADVRSRLVRRLERDFREQLRDLLPTELLARRSLFRLRFTMCPQLVRELVLVGHEDSSAFPLHFDAIQLPSDAPFTDARLERWPNERRRGLGPVLPRRVLIGVEGADAALLRLTGAHAVVVFRSRAFPPLGSTVDGGEAALQREPRWSGDYIWRAACLHAPS